MLLLQQVESNFQEHSVNVVVSYMVVVLHPCPAARSWPSYSSGSEVPGVSRFRDPF